MKSRQTRFSSPVFKANDKFGGELSKSRRFRTARPVSTKETMHLVLKSSLAKGRLSFRAPGHRQKIETILQKNCAKFGVRLIKASNNFNHLHLQVKFSSRELYKRFVRAISGHIAMAVTGASKTKPISTILGRKNFWDHRPFSRIVRGRRGFKIVNDYIRLNQLEAEGAIPKRSDRLRGVKPMERALFENESSSMNRATNPQLGFL
jgi:REP element-mobilizing transposase RayT